MQSKISRVLCLGGINSPKGIFFLQTMLLLYAITSISFFQRNIEAGGLGDAAKRNHLQILGKPQNICWSNRCQCLACYSY